MEKYLDTVASMEKISLYSHSTHPRRAWMSEGARASEKREKTVIENILESSWQLAKE